MYEKLICISSRARWHDSDNGLVIYAGFLFIIPSPDLWICNCCLVSGRQEDIPSFVLQVAAIKLFSLKVDYMAVLLYSLYRVREDANKTSIAIDVASALKVGRPQQHKVVQKQTCT